MIVVSDQMLQWPLDPFSGWGATAGSFTCYLWFFPTVAPAPCFRKTSKVNQIFHGTQDICSRQP